MSSLLENSTIKITSVAGILFCAFGIYAWAEGEHKSLKEIANDQSKLIAEQREENRLLKQIVKNQSELVKKAAENAQANRETLIRIEAKLAND